MGSKVIMVHHLNVQITDRERTREWYQRVLGCTFLDRGELNKRQLQLNLGNSEMHFSEVNEVTLHPSVHFAVEVQNWDEMLAHLDKESVSYSRMGGGAASRLIGGDHPLFGNREDNGEFYTYIHDPDGNMIELVCHPQGLKNSKGQRMALTNDPEGMRWGQLPEVEEALGKV
jgi:catechol 2,3-dioxygenase-like lactoylglutathione lyase family enzyme